MATPTPEQQGAFTQNALLYEENFNQAQVGGATPFPAPAASNDTPNSDATNQQYFATRVYQP